MIDRLSNPSNKYASDLGGERRVASGFHGKDSAMRAYDSVPHSSAGLKRLIGSVLGTRLEEVEHRLRQSVRSQYDVVDVLSQRASAMGGKRMRPMLVLLASQSCGDGIESGSRCSRAELADIAASVELVHAASLVHDDIMDGAEQRRHQTTIHASSGASAAILLGDFLFTRAYGLAASGRSTIPARWISDAATDLCEGELRQQASVGDFDLSLKEYRSILGQKTASLCAVSCRLGGWAEKATKPQLLSLSRYGSALGLAFQIFDDWLDYWGSNEVGKTLGTDFAQAKPTLPLLHFLSGLNHGERGRTVRMLEAGDSSALKDIFDAVRCSASGDYTLKVARKLAARAVTEIAALPLSPARQCLEGIAYFSVNRES